MLRIAGRTMKAGLAHLGLHPSRRRWRASSSDNGKAVAQG
jgi:hypothetical protein